MRNFGYATPSSCDEILTQLNARDRPLAGGTDLLPLLKPGIVDVDRLIDIKRAGLPAGVVEEDDGISIGALTTLDAIEHDELLAARQPMLVDAVRVTATRQIRNRATVGGNLLQRPRCWYFRDPDVVCWLEGGDDCPAVDGRNSRHAIFGEGPCHAAHPSDLAGSLLAADADVTLLGPRGARRLPLGDFFRLPDDTRRNETAIDPDELLERVTLPHRAGDWRSVYLKIMERASWTFALVGLALAVRVRDGRIDDARVVLTGVAPVPWRLPECEAYLRDIGDPEHAARAAARVVESHARPLAENAYKIRLARSLLERALEELLERRGDPRWNQK